MHKATDVCLRRHFLGRLVGLGGAAAVGALPGRASAASSDRTVLGTNVRQAGAVGDGTVLETKVLQRAIDQCAQGGGGTVYFPAGTYLTGSLVLRSRVNLLLDAGAILLGSRNLEDYQVVVPKLRSYTDNYTERSLIYGENLENISIQGRGVIDGQGAAFRGPYKVRPYLMRLVSCRDVAVKDITLKNSPMWVQHYLACDRVLIDGIQVQSRCNANNDGIDIDGCHQVRIANCDISSGDDAIVLKATLDRACKNVVITNCVLSSACSAFKLGTESNGGFENITLSNCAIYDTDLAGIALEMVDGGRLERVNISNITMQNVNGPIFIRLGNRARPFKAEMAKPGQGNLRNISISHVQAVGANRIGCSISGLPGAVVEHVSLSDIQIGFAGGGTEKDAARPVPEHADKYPEYSMFGMLPAYGFFCRHARHLRLEDVRLEVARPDERPALFCEDVEDVEISRLRAAAASKGSSVIRLNDTRDAWVQGCRCLAEAAKFLRVNGKMSRKIKLSANEINETTQAVEAGPEVEKGAVTFGEK